MRLLVSGGGTGGHIYPALSLIKEVKKQIPEAEILYIGTKNGLESNLVPREGIPFKTITISGFKRKVSLDNVKTIYRFVKAKADAKKIIKEFKPDVVIGTGGYVSGPVVYAATKLKVPTVIHEQNSVPGLTNKFLSRYVQKVAISFKESSSFFPKEKVVYTGNPRASEAASFAKQVEAKEKTVLIVGGSRGARPINDAFLEGLKEVRNKPYRFLYVTGQIHFDAVIKEVERQGSPKNVQIEPFLHNMPEVMASSNLIVTRAGATTLAEITALGIPSILIPSPYVTNNHQEKNARALSTNGAAIVRLEKELDGKKLLQDIDSVLSDEETAKNMHQAAKLLGKPEAASELLDVLRGVMKKR